MYRERRQAERIVCWFWNVLQTFDVRILSCKNHWRNSEWDVVLTNHLYLFFLLVGTLAREWRGKKKRKAQHLGCYFNRPQAVLQTAGEVTSLFRLSYVSESSQKNKSHSGSLSKWSFIQKIYYAEDGGGAWGTTGGAFGDLEPCKDQLPDKSSSLWRRHWKQRKKGEKLFPSPSLHFAVVSPIC